MDTIKILEEYIEKNRLKEATQLIEKGIQNEPSNEKLLFLKGKIHYKKQEWGDAINVFYQVLELDPNHHEAQSQIEMAKAILGYYTPDMFNP